MHENSWHLRKEWFTSDTYPDSNCKPCRLDSSSNLCFHFSYATRSQLHESTARGTPSSLEDLCTECGTPPFQLSENLPLCSVDGHEFCALVHEKSEHWLPFFGSLCYCLFCLGNRISSCSPIWPLPQRDVSASSAASRRLGLKVHTTTLRQLAFNSSTKGLCH